MCMENGIVRLYGKINVSTVMAHFSKKSNHLSGAALVRVGGVRPNPYIFRGGFSNLSIFGPLEQTISNLEVYMRWEGT